MVTPLRQLPESFEALPPTEPHQVTVEILRRAAIGAAGDIPDEGLLQAADELFRQMDADEESIGAEKQ